MPEQIDIVIQPGGKLAIPPGTDQSAGLEVLVAGTVTVANTRITAATLIQLTPTNSSGVAGFLSYTVSAGASFTINSSSILDTRTITYLIIENA